MYDYIRYKQSVIVYTIVSIHLLCTIVSGSGEEQNRSKNQYTNGAERMTNQCYWLPETAQHQLFRFFSMEHLLHTLMQHARKYSGSS